MLAWLLAAIVVVTVTGIAVACAVQARLDTREHPRLDAETEAILSDWTED